MSGGGDTTPPGCLWLLNFSNITNF
jgi:hypothetical protein